MKYFKDFLYFEGRWWWLLLVFLPLAWYGVVHDFWHPEHHQLWYRGSWVVLGTVVLMANVWAVLAEEGSSGSTSVRRL